MKKVLSLFLALSSLQAFAIAPGDTVSKIVLEYGEGQKVEGGAFSTDEMKGKLAVLFYVDPDEKDTNEAFSQALVEKNYSLDQYSSFAIINMAATWLPNFAIASSLKEKQKKYTRTVYAMDLRKNFVKQWALSDDASVIVIMDKEGKVLYRHDGKMDDSEIQKAIKIIEANINV
tara:strand:- start:8030 stop:8551 length:522 start_codon:yes stop_codon:yes gene_type:complete